MENLTTPQLKILTTLLFSPKSRFKELNTDCLETDSFSYYIRLLIKDGLIIKEGLFYSLTSKGKMAAGKIDTATHTVEKQPKVSVIIIPHKRVGKEELFLIQQRTKEPYFGYWGFITGKVRFGETLEQTAQRELEEESGLKGEFKFCYEIHEMVYDRALGGQLEDKFFHIMEVFNLSGNLLENTKEGNTKFVSAKEFKEIGPKYHNEEDIFNWFLKKDFKFKEEKYYIEKF